MATAAEPRPAELPLPGGREGARVRLHPLLTGQMKESRLAWRRAIGLGAKDEAWLTVPVPAFLVEHPGVGAILIDTGFHPSVAVKPQENLGRLSRLTFRDVQMRPEQAAPAQLRARGIEPSAVKVVLMTHLHVDRASAISEFPESTFVVSAAEWAAASSQGERHGYVKRQFDHGFDYRLLDFEGSGAESFSGFARSFDVFGDGSVRAVYTPGHTLGHMSVVLRTARGEVLIAADAVYEAPDRTEDEHLFRRSLREIRQYAAETPDALIVPGHDWEAWQQLEATY